MEAIHPKPFQPVLPTELALDRRQPLDASVCITNVQKTTDQKINLLAKAATKRYIWDLIQNVT
ncbi:MAG: hypothetical protein ACKO4U_07155 [Caldilinea sp.]